MDLKNIVSVSGLGRLFKMDTQRENGLIVEPLEGGKKKFVSARKHMFTPLENITIYTLDDSMAIKEVFERMKNKEEELATANPKKSTDEELHAYMANIAPEYDPERVYASDIKKMIKWYKALDAQGLVTVEEGAESEEADNKDDQNEEEE
jgi:hypothetical protein